MTLHRCPDCRCHEDDRTPQPATSSEWSRRQALDAAEAAVRAAKERRKAIGPNDRAPSEIHLGDLYDPGMPL